MRQKERLCPICHFHVLARYQHTCASCKLAQVREKRNECLLCGEKLTGTAKKYCADCRHTNVDLIAEQTHRQREHEKRSQRRKRHPMWTEEEWRLYDERQSVKQHAQQVAINQQQKRQDIRAQRREEWYAKKNRVRQRRTHGYIVCYWCEEYISDEDIKRMHYQKGRMPKFHNRQCLHAWRQHFGMYQIMSTFGNEAQARYTAEFGEIPHYVKRSAAVRKANQGQPKRRKLRKEE